MLCIDENVLCYGNKESDVSGELIYEVHLVENPLEMSEVHLCSVCGDFFGVAWRAPKISAFVKGRSWERRTSCRSKEMHVSKMGSTNATYTRFT